MVKASASVQNDDWKARVALEATKGGAEGKRVRYADSRRDTGNSHVRTGRSLFARLAHADGRNEKCGP